MLFKRLGQRKRDSFEFGAVCTYVPERIVIEFEQFSGGGDLTVVYARPNHLRAGDRASKVECWVE